MASRERDTLLNVARIIVTVAQALMVVGALALIVAVPIILLSQGEMLQEIRAEFGPQASLPLPIILTVLAASFVTVALAWHFLRNLRRIIDTVGEGDPFVPVNANRLTAMAWLMLAIQGMSIVLGSLAFVASRTLHEPLVMADINIDLGGIVLVITLFILARVFRLGAAMRDDLQGTV